MIKKQHALAQLNLLRHADVLAVRAAAETVLWLNDQLACQAICTDKFNALVQSYYDFINTIDQPVGKVCSRALQDLLEIEKPTL